MEETVKQKIEQFRQLAGERFGKIELSTVISAIVADNRREAAEQFARERGWAGVSADQVLAMPSVFIGSADTVVADIQARREAYAFSYLVVSDQVVRNFAPIVERLARR